MLKDWFVVEPAPLIEEAVLYTTNSLSKLQSAAGKFLDKIFDKQNNNEDNECQN